MSGLAVNWLKTRWLLVTFIIAMLTGSSVQADNLRDWLRNRQANQQTNRQQTNQQTLVVPPVQVIQPNGSVVVLSPVQPGQVGQVPVTPMPAGQAVTVPNAQPLVTQPTPTVVRPQTPQGGFSVHYRARTRYRSRWVQVPTTVYRPVTTTDPVTGVVSSAMQPCLTYTWQQRRVPVTIWRPTGISQAVPATGLQTIVPNTVAVPQATPAGTVIPSTPAPAGTVAPPGTTIPGWSTPANAAPANTTPGAGWPNTPGVQSPANTNDPASIRPEIDAGDRMRLEGSVPMGTNQRTNSTLKPLVPLVGTAAAKSQTSAINGNDTRASSDGSKVRALEPKFRLKPIPDPNAKPPEKPDTRLDNPRDRVAFGR